MKVSFTLKDLTLDIGNALDLFSSIPLSGFVSYKIAPTLKSLRAEAKKFYEAQDIMLENHGITTEAVPELPGQMRYAAADKELSEEDATAAVKAFMDERNALLKTEVSLDVTPIPLSAFHKANGRPDIDNKEDWHSFSELHMEALHFIIQDDVTEVKTELKAVN